MTLSILALDRISGALGVAAATGNLAVGAWVPRVVAGVGAVATQGHSVSPLWGDQAMRRLADGESPDAVVGALTQGDSGASWRQLSVLDSQGNGAAYTGNRNSEVRGHLLTPGCVVAGNWLSSSRVLEVLRDTWLASLDDSDMSFAGKLLVALQAAVSHGTDSRGLQSAAMQVVSVDQPPLDLRIDYHTQPIQALQHLYERATEQAYVEWMMCVPTLNDPWRH